ncbi:pantetheine-phosphate adenylyltransferase [bacterium]|nr:pantetheine-phosphate adenylyltransferase [bacterium]
MKKNIIVYPGSFDPFTFGHEDLVNRALNIFDEVVVAVLENPKKDTLLSVEERIEIIKNYFKGNDSVKIVAFEGLLVDFLKTNGLNIIMRGMRMLSDFEFEFQMSLTNRRLFKDFEAIYLVPAMKFSFISSSIVREIASFNGDLDEFVNKHTKEILYEKFNQK